MCGFAPRRSRLDDDLAGAVGFDEPHPQLVEHLLEHLTFLGRQIAARFLVQQRQDVDDLTGRF